MLLETINKFISMISNLSERIDKDISMSYLEYEKENKEFKLLELEKEEKKYRKLLDDIKEDYKNNDISKVDLDIFKDRYLYELNNILLEKDELNNSNSSKENIERINNIRKIGKLDYIDINILNELVDVIYITEERGINVIFKYNNLHEDAMRYLE